MNVLEAITHRQSVRRFLQKPVPLTLIQEILEHARFAPSGVNTQPWQVVVVGPKTIQRIGDAIIPLREQGIEPNPDYHYYPEQWVEPYKERRKACGAALYGALNIQYGDAEKRKAAWYRNYYFFEAPWGLLFFIDKNLEKGSWLDCGLFIQNCMLAARGLELETCPQASLSEYPDVVRKIVNVSSDLHLICGMAVGYADWSDPINQYRTTREPVESFTTWLD